MGDFPRKADGRRIFTVEFKRGVVQQIVKGEKTLAEVSRELDIQPTVIRQWKQRVEAGAATAVAADEDVVPDSHPHLSSKLGSRPAGHPFGPSTLLGIVRNRTVPNTKEAQ